MNNILFVFNSLGIGGSQKIEAFVANACLKAGYKVSVISFTKTDVGVDIDKSIDISYVEYKNGKNLKALVSKARFIIKLRKEILRHNPDCICVFLADITRVVTTACFGLNIPIIGSERGAPGRHGKKLQNYNRAFNKCEYVIFQTPQARKYYTLPDEKCCIIANPCKLRWDSKIPNYEISKKVILSAGRLCRQKRFDVLIDAFKIVYEKHPDYRLEIYGSGPLENLLKDQISKLDLTNSIILCGYKADVFGVAGVPEIFALSSDYEGIPNILMEAMALGSACVSTDCEPGGADLLFNGNERGLLSSIGDPSGLAANIIDFIENDELKHRYSERAKEIINIFSPLEIEKQWISIFDKVLGLK